MLRSVLTAIVLVSLLGASTAKAEEVDSATNVAPELAQSATTAMNSWHVRADLDAAIFLNSRSNTIGHLVKPAMRVTVDRPWRLGDLSKLRVGAQAFAVVDSNSHYRVWGAMASASYALIDGSRFGLLANASLGAGVNADILHSDRDASLPVVPYGALGLRADVALPGGASIGPQLFWTNLSVITVGVGGKISL